MTAPASGRDVFELDNDIIFVGLDASNGEVTRIIVTSIRAALPDVLDYTRIFDGAGATLKRRGRSRYRSRRREANGGEKRSD